MHITHFALNVMDRLENVMNGKVCEAEKIDARKDTVISLSGEIRKGNGEVQQTH